VAGAGFAVAATLRGAGINVMVVEQSGKVAASYGSRGFRRWNRVEAQRGGAHLDDCALPRDDFLRRIRNGSRRTIFGWMQARANRVPRVGSRSIASEWFSYPVASPSTKGTSTGHEVLCIGLLGVFSISAGDSVIAEDA
jgi:hypothetical protein